MSHKAYYKKSFGIENERLLGGLALFIAATIVTQDLTFGFEIHLCNPHLTIPLHLLASSVVIYIFWRMSKVKPDYNGEEPYEVIYGGQESETKKSLDSK
ncbi:hypothetical protein GCK72_007641 [Caenorhabditis remanei]|uniref:Uncharacterized protein n=1 Tax=Caenorhabditis remanei TaxID=31234 RepID=A0A6A5HPF1_CAERE|nr:hypothetical protein GCK72_007641 [Caenorhabditis remanei]KAF1767682.1 hypothetical protein GCK72_007641 [Caenorhabditis remanei]